MLNQIVQYVKYNYAQLISDTLYTLGYLIIIPTLIASVIGISLGLIAAHNKSLSRLIISTSNILQTIPSLAMFTLLMAIGMGVGLRPSMIAITIYGILPIVTNTYLGITNMDASKGKILGMNKLQTLVYIQIPMASPSILTGVKLAFISASSCASLSAMIGARGLGYYIYFGMAQVKYYICVIGVIPTIIISVSIDILMSKLIKLLQEKVKLYV